MKPYIFKIKKSGLFFTALLLLVSALSVHAATVTMGVTFGNPQSNGGDCVGKGVCKESLIVAKVVGIAPSPVSPEAVSVSFVTSSSNPDVLLMRFSLSELSMKQPSKVASFTDPEGYMFDSPYSLMRPVFSPLGLLPGAMVQTSVRFTVLITGDVITVYIPYSHA